MNSRIYEAEVEGRWGDTAAIAARRRQLAEALGVPAYLSANRLLELVNTTVTAEEWADLTDVWNA